jgi:hypothetical protein
VKKSSESVREMHGYFWWLGEETPEGRFAPTTAVPGTLMISEDGLAKLTLTGSLIQSSFLQLDTATKRHADMHLDALAGKTIVGKVDDDMRCVYLQQVVYQEGGRTLDHRLLENYRAAICLVGESTTPLPPDAFTFSRLSIELTGLEEWRRHDALRVDAAKTEGERQSQVVSYTAEQWEYGIDEGSVSLRTDVHCTALHDIGTQKISFEQHDWIDYAPSTSQSPEELKQEFGYIEELLALLSGSYYALKWPQISTNRSSRVDAYTLYFHRRTEKLPPPEAWELWTFFPQVRDSFGTIYGNWRKKRREHGAGFYLHLAALRNSSMYVEHRFVNLVWGIESLHRSLFPLAKGPSSDKAIIKSLLTNLAEHLKPKQAKWLEKQFERSTEPTLQDRIVETFKTLPWQIEIKTLREFAKRCQDRRNDISHFGGPRKEKNESYEVFLQDLIQLSAALSRLYHAALLKEIGVEDPTVRSTLFDMPVNFRIRQEFERVGLSIPKRPEPATPPARAR